MNQSFLTRLRLYLKQHRPLLLVVLVTILIIIGVLIRLFTPSLTPQAPISTETTLPALNNLDYTITDLRFTGTPVDLPTTLKYYQVTPSSTRELVANIVRSLNLIPHSDLTNFWLSQDKTTTLTVNEQSLVTFAAITPIETLPSDYSTETAITTAQEQLSRFGLNPESFELESTQYLSGEGELVSSPQNPTFFEVRFTPKINGYPLIYGSQTEPFFIFYLNSNYQINKAIFSPLTYTIKQEFTSPTLDLNQALNNINQGEYTVINIYSDITSPNIDPNLDRVNFTNVSLEYRFNPVSNLILPYFHFIGLEDSDAGRQNIELLTPAIEISNSN